MVCSDLFATPMPQRRRRRLLAGILQDCHGTLLAVIESNPDAAREPTLADGHARAGEEFCPSANRCSRTSATNQARYEFDSRRVYLTWNFIVELEDRRTKEAGQIQEHLLKLGAKSLGVQRVLVETMPSSRRRK